MHAFVLKFVAQILFNLIWSWDVFGSDVFMERGQMHSGVNIEFEGSWFKPN